MQDIQKQREINCSYLCVNKLDLFIFYIEIVVKLKSALLVINNIATKVNVTVCVCVCVQEILYVIMYKKLQNICIED